ncbi:hypothetical protein LG212_26060, partial [Escherichia coli]|nr:hypothetical protein [Escherichia coli]
FHTIVSIKNDGHYFCRAGGNRPDGLNEPVTLVDIYLWTFKRFMEDKALTKPLSRLVYTNLKTARTNSVSIQSVASRFKELLGKLPVPSAEIMRQAQELRDFDEARRMPYVVSGSPD